MGRRGLRISKIRQRVLRLIRLNRKGLTYWSRIEDYKRSLKGWRRWSRRGLKSSKSKLRVRRLIRLSRRGLTYWSRIEDYKRSLKGWRR